MWTRLARPAIAVAAMLLPLGMADAMQVSPMVVELTTNGTGATARIEILNINAAPLPFEARVMRIDFDDRGVMHETPADADFLVFPPQGVLAKGSRQVVRLQWVGGPLDSSRGYYVSINQLPAELANNATPADKLGASVQVLYHIKVLATVAPPNSAPKIAVEAVKPAMIAAPPPPVATLPDQAPGKAPAAAPANAGAEQPGIEITVVNSGKRYALMAGSTWTIEGTGTDRQPLKVVLTSDDLNHILGAGYVPALGGRRTFKVPTGKAFGAAPIKVRFSA